MHMQMRILLIVDSFLRVLAAQTGNSNEYLCLLKRSEEILGTSNGDYFEIQLLHQIMLCCEK
jgi:hypothetical protein